MAFAGHCGIDVDIAGLHEDSVAVLFNEELGAVLQVNANDSQTVLQKFSAAGISALPIGTPNSSDKLRFMRGEELLLESERVTLQRLWSETSYHIQALRDNPDCARQEYDGILLDDPGLSVGLNFDVDEDVAAPYINSGVRPRVAILREQGVNGQLEMAAAFDRAGFEAIDVHMSDILSGRINLEAFKGLAACGGFSYGDVLGAGEGWAKTILFNSRAREQFQQYFQRQDTFSLGICNGCQMMSNLKSLIPGADNWPRFVRNLSEQFEARVVLAKIPVSPSVLLQGMQGSHMPVAVAHGEGRAEFRDAAHMNAFNDSAAVAMRYVDNHLQVSERYPANPNGSPFGIGGVTSEDGRVTLLMPHPERVFRAVQNSWKPDDWNEDAAWMRLFRNARVWVG
jgi:phosphoribosylformylglycinamidine synthase